MEEEEEELAVEVTSLSARCFALAINTLVRGGEAVWRVSEFRLPLFKVALPRRCMAVSGSRCRKQRRMRRKETDQLPYGWRVVTVARGTIYQVVISIKGF